MGGTDAADEEDPTTDYDPAGNMTRKVVERETATGTSVTTEVRDDTT